MSPYSYFKIISPTCSFEETKLIRKINSRMLILLSLLLLASISLIDLVSAQDEKNVLHSYTENESPMHIMAVKIDNESIYRNLLNSTWDQYNEDINYSSNILTDFVKKNITRREAMVATISLYTLTSKTEDEFYKVNTNDKYKNIHNNTIYALSNLKGYLWNITKFYETDKTVYAVKARESFNSSLGYFEKARGEYESKFRDQKIVSLTLTNLQH